MYYVGIDLGGTNIVAGVVDDEFNIVAKADCKTAVPRPENEICDSMVAVTMAALAKAKISLEEGLQKTILYFKETLLK